MATPLIGGKFFDPRAAGLTPGAALYTYAAGTLTPLATYTDAGGLSSNTNPVILNVYGQADVFLGTSAYRMRLYSDTIDNGGVLLWDEDNIATVGGSNGTTFIGWLRAATSAVATTLYDWLDWQNISAFEFMTFAQKVDVKAKTYTLDVSAAVAAGNAAVLAKGSGKYRLPAGGYRLNSSVARSPTVDWVGDGSEATVLRAYHNGVAVTAGSVPVVSPAGDNFCGISDMTIRNGGAFVSSILYFRAGLVCSGITRVRFTDATIGWQDQFVLNSWVTDTTSECTTPFKIKDTSYSDPCNNNDYDRIHCSGNAAMTGAVIDAAHSYGCEFDSNNYENAITPLNISGANGFRWRNLYLEGNTNGMKLTGGEELDFTVRNISAVDPIDSATFGAKRVRIRVTDNSNAGVFQHAEIDSHVTILDSAGFSGQDVVMVHDGWGDKVSKYAHQPNHLATGAVSGQAIVSPFGGAIGRVKNFVESQDMSNAAFWTSSQSVGGAADPYGGTTAYTLPSTLTEHATISLGSAATGRTFTAQVWLYCLAAGVIKIAAGIGGTAYKTTTVRLSNKGAWLLLSATFTSPTNASTSGYFAITKSSGTILAWRPCFYESPTVHPAIAAQRDLTGIVLPMEVKNTSVYVIASALPTVGAFVIGDMAENVAGVTGQAKRWRRVTTGTAHVLATDWVSEGNL